MQQVLFNPVKDCLSDYLHHVVPHQELVDLLLPCIREQLLSYHEFVLAQGNLQPHLSRSLI